ncbi:MAG: thermonuclease family protein [Fibrobacterota bacterium]
MTVAEVLSPCRVKSKEGIEIKFLGLVCPEKGDPAAAEAFAFTKALLLNKRIDLRYGAKSSDNTGSLRKAYPYLICDTCAGSSYDMSGGTNTLTMTAPLVNVSNEILEKGFARADTAMEFEKKDYFVYLESTARKKKAGIWKNRDKSGVKAE